MEASVFPTENQNLGSTPGPSQSYYGHGIHDPYATANEFSIYNSLNEPFTPQSSLPSSSNRYTNDYQTFSRTIGEGFSNNLSTGEQQTVEDQCSGDHPVEHDHSEPNAHGSNLYGLNNALEWPPRAYESIEGEMPHTNAGTWTDESIAPEQPAPSTSQVQGHVPSCMGGLGVSVTHDDGGGCTTSRAQDKIKINTVLDVLQRGPAATVGNEGVIEGRAGRLR
ncbi:hypothetical protein JR316_0010374 [Psilocybe cubensis]|nr:hypothetical protein JR316_0010374 [Psilocybe cubensis]KAH9476462.1 hypothetical protein JR316_0010374 [Psilocybe cubensis]